MRWPWQARETRADSSYTDALVAAITANAGGQSTAFPTATAALEAAAGVVGRAFASASVRAPDAMRDALGPACLSMIGRSLIRRGEILFLIKVDGGRVKLWPAASHDITGGPDPDSWAYRLTVGGPERTLTYPSVPAAGVIHLQYSRDPEHPWRGYGPLQVAQLGGRLSSETVAALADEASGPRGSLLPLPMPGDDPTIELLKADLKKLKGQLATVETTQSMAPGAAGTNDGWIARRIGAEPPAALVQLHEIATREVLGACGIPPVLFSSNPNGTAGREAWRQLLFATVAPLGRLVVAELAAKLEADVALDWDELRASDVASRARAFQSMVGAGMDLAKAAALSGLMVEAD